VTGGLSRSPTATCSARTALEVYADGTCYVEFTFRPQTLYEDGDFLQAEVSPDQLETADS
jgi:hypothetical protein